MKTLRPILGPVVRRGVPLKPWQRVYIARRDSDGAIKIGLSHDPDLRMVDLRRLHGKMTMLADLFGGRPYERELLWRFREYSLPNENEWFRAHDELLSFIKEVAGTCADDSLCSERADDGTVRIQHCPRFHEDLCDD